MILLIDNYDSFTYNLVQYFGQLGAKIEVRRNDAITLDEISLLSPSHLVISPALVRPMKRAFRWTQSVNLPVKFRFWGFVWVIRRLRRPLAGR